MPSKVQSRGTNGLCLGVVRSYVQDPLVWEVLDGTCGGRGPTAEPMGWLLGIKNVEMNVLLVVVSILSLLHIPGVPSY